MANQKDPKTNLQIMTCVKRLSTWVDEGSHQKVAAIQVPN